MPRWLEIDPGVFRENFDRGPFRIRHRLAEHPLSLAGRGLDFTAYRPGVAILAQLAFVRARELVRIAWR